MPITGEKGRRVVNIVGGLTAFQIIYFAVSVYCRYLCDLCAKRSVFRCTNVNLNEKQCTNIFGVHFKHESVVYSVHLSRLSVFCFLFFFYFFIFGNSSVNFVSQMARNPREMVVVARLVMYLACVWVKIGESIFFGWTKKFSKLDN